LQGNRRRDELRKEGAQITFPYRFNAFQRSFKCAKRPPEIIKVKVFLNKL